MLLAINLKNRDSVLSVDLIAWRAPDSASSGVLVKHALLIEERKAEWASVKDLAAELSRHLDIVPSFDGRLADLDELNCLELLLVSDEVVGFLLGQTRVDVIAKELLALSFFCLLVSLILVESSANQLSVGVNHCFANPAIVPSLKLQIVHIVLILLTGRAFALT